MNRWMGKREDRFRPWDVADGDWISFCEKSGCIATQSRGSRHPHLSCLQGAKGQLDQQRVIRPMRCRSTRSHGKSIRPRPMRRMTPSHWSLTLHDNTSASERLDSCRGPGMMVHNLQHSLLMERRPLTQLPWLLFSVSMWGLGIALSALIIEKLYFQ